MKRKILILTSLLVLAGCGGQKDSTSTSLDGVSINPPITSGDPVSEDVSPSTSEEGPISDNTSISNEPL